MLRQRLDVELVRRGLVQSRSQAENYVKLGDVYVNKKVVQSQTNQRLCLVFTTTNRADRLSDRYGFFL